MRVMFYKLFSITYILLLIYRQVVLICGQIQSDFVLESNDIDMFIEDVRKAQSDKSDDIHSIFKKTNPLSITAYEVAFLSFLEYIIDNNAVGTLHNILQAKVADAIITEDSLLCAYNNMNIRFQYQIPPLQRVSELSKQMVNTLIDWEKALLDRGEYLDIFQDELPPKGTHWRGVVDGLITNMKVNSSIFYNYYFMKSEPQVFAWPILRDTYSSHSASFKKIYESPLYYTVWEPGLLRSTHFMHMRHEGRLLTNIKREFLPFRNERICHMYGWYLLNDLLDITPDWSVQVVEYGGGTGDLVAMHADMGFNGTHIVYDMLPMLLMQRYFLRFSGHTAFLLNENNGDMLTSLSKRKTVRSLAILVPPSYLTSHLLPDRSHFAMAHTVVLATYSLTESDLASRHSFTKYIAGVGVVLISGNENHFGNDNVKYIIDLSETSLVKYHCAFLGGNFPSEFFFIAARQDLFVSIDPNNKFRKTYMKSRGRCPILERRDA